MEKRMIKVAIGTICFVAAAVCLGFGLYLLPATAWRTISVWLIIIGVVLVLIGIRLFVERQKTKKKGDIRIMYTDPNMNKLAQARRKDNARATRAASRGYGGSSYNRYR